MGGQLFQFILRIVFAVLLYVVVVGPSIQTACAQSAGQRTYMQQCASCHGEKGQGVDDEYKERLIGDKSVVELAEYITNRMPDGEPQVCVGNDAKAVASWMFEAFYSPAAQARNQPPRIELARLTANQYRNTVADVIANFVPVNDIPRNRGLLGEYYDSKQFNPGKKKINRIDPVVNFNYGEESPDPQLGKDEFSMQWLGGLIVPESGEYEIIVVTDNGIKLWVNDPDEPIYDGWVRSGDAVTHRKSMQLLGGRMYYLKLHCYKFGEKTARVELKWKRPHHVEEPIPNRFLSPVVGGTHLVVETKFPPEDLSYGYPRATSISRAWHSATTQAAIEVSERIAAGAERLTGYKPEQDKRGQKLYTFAIKFAELALRRKITPQQREFYVDRHFKEAPGPLVALRRSVLLILKSPVFLYREIQPGHDHYDVASRLSYTLWDSIPDRQLREAAGRNELNNVFALKFQAERMVKDARTQVKLKRFLHHYLRMDHVTDPVKDAEAFPQYDDALLSDFRKSLDLFLDEIIWSKESDYRKLMLTDHLWMNGRMADFYGTKVQDKSQFQRLRYEPNYRAGVLSHPFLMTGFAYQSTTSPIHRGVFVARNLLGRMLRPPPDAVAPLPPDVHADLTTRERTIIQTKPENCATCHQMINPLGFPLENFDAVGRFRKSEKEKPIDARGSYRTRGGKTVTFNGPREMAKFVANSPEVHQAFVEQLFHHSVQQPVLAFGLTTPGELTKGFQTNQFSVQKLLAAIAIRAAGHEFLQQKKTARK